MVSNNPRDYFGPAISTYTRAQAFEDGVLVDLEGHADTRIFKHPVAFTAALWDTIEAGLKKDADPGPIIWDVCIMATMPTAKVEGSDSFYPVTVHRKTLKLRCNVGPGDNAEPVVTIGYPEDF